MTAPKFSIPTEYHGTQFRSKLESDYARHFDTLELSWKYETTGRHFGDVFYLPDFWLPRSRQYVEVKGVFAPADHTKTGALLRHVEPRPYTDEFCPDVPLVVCLPRGKFFGFERGGCAGPGPAEFARIGGRFVELMQCGVCRGWWFAEPSWGWRCQCCGAYDGNGHIIDRYDAFADFPNIHALHS